MPEIPVGAQVFDVVFHPTSSIVYTGLLTGYVNAYAYNEQGNHKPIFSLRPAKSSCRGLSLNHDGSRLFAVSKGKSLSIIDTSTESLDVRTGAHTVAVNRVKCLMPSLLSTGDDDGVVKLWDPRQKDSIQTYTQHFDYITDFLWLDDKKHLVATSGDGTLSVMDVRAKKAEPFAQSEDQEDELLSIVAIKGASKFVVGTQLGILSIFNRSRGWGDCVDRVPGHPLSVDALCALPDDLPNIDTASTILTGSSDGYVRAVEILPTKLLGVVADHGEWPVERIAVGSGTTQLFIDSEDDESSAKAEKIGATAGSAPEGDGHPGRWWIGSVGHEETLRLTDLQGFFRGLESEEAGKGDLDMDARDEDSDVEENADEHESAQHEGKSGTREPEENEEGSDSDNDSDPPQPKKRKRKPEKQLTPVAKKAKGKQAIVDRSFFDEL